MKNIAVLVFVLLFSASLAYCQPSDAALRAVMEKDRTSRTAKGDLVGLTAAEHAVRGRVYLENRHFPEAREHFERIVEDFAGAPELSYALFGMGRSLMWERRYAEAIPWFQRAAKEFPASKDGRESLAFDGACNVRLGRNMEAAAAYEKYTVMYPDGERFESAFLNIIDAYREAGEFGLANTWVDKARAQFAGSPTETNALHARLRMEIARGDWLSAVTAADALLTLNRFAASMCSQDEVVYLRGFALEHAGKKADASAAYRSIAGRDSYFGGLANDKVGGSGGRVKRIVQSARSTDYPAAFRAEVLKYSKKKRLDPRFVLAIMKQESTFRPGIKSPSAARGLLQLVMDTAEKYAASAGFADLKPDDLYVPETNIAIGCEYLRSLSDEFGGLYEAIAASYNGGEDNAARWLARSRGKDAAIFASEVGFAETKNYVFKVMNNYRVYRELYTEDLVKR